MKQLELNKSVNLLKKHKINFVNYKKINSEKDLNDLNYPIALKISAKNIIHKTDAGGVILNIANKEQAINEFNKLKKISKEIIMQEMVSGKEIIIGMKKDPQFGPVIMFGLGGIFVEILKDVSFRICPIEKDQALEMIKEIKSFKILEGIRGEQPININELSALIVKISNLATKEEITEIDLNPVIVDSKKATVVDVRFMV
jgi:acetate---CoA ligase (ADP-forming) subunit beta